jgi:hypothetical protein
MAEKTNKERLAKIETSQEFMREDIKEIKEVCKEIPKMKTIVGLFSILISAAVAGVTSYFVRHT